MMALSFAQFMAGISAQESGGNYAAVNRGSGALGKYQVMPSNVAGWSRQVLGYSITPSQFLHSPQLQEKIVSGILHGYFNKWGPRGAAAAWYAGPGNHNLDQSTRSQYGGPSIKGYVDSVMNHAGASSGDVSSYSSDATASAAKMSKGEIAESYGFSEAFLDSNPELKPLFKRAAAEGWAPGKFQAEMRDTKWWKTHSATERTFLADSFGDPKTADQKMQQAFIHVRQLAAQMGIVENPDQMKRMKSWAYNYAAKGWDDAMLRDTIGKFVYFNKGEQGEGGDTINQLRSYAYAMGVTMSDKWYTNNARSVIRGVAALQDYKDQILKQAKATYGQYSKQLDAGQTMADIASPYIQSMQTILEVPAGGLSLQDKTIKAALQYKNPTTGATESKPLWQFENDLRNDPRWKSTQNAQNSMMQVAHQVLSDFGVAH
jgi:flagellin-like hook-associated protein FlgL